MDDNDNVKYTALGLVAGGLALGMVMSWMFLAKTLVVLGGIVLGYVLHKEGLGGGATGTRRATLAAQGALVVLAFSIPFLFLVKAASEDRKMSRIISTQAQSDLKNTRSGLAELESSAGVQVSDAGLQREERRNLALQVDIQNLQTRLEFVAGKSYSIPEGETDILDYLKNKCVDDAANRLKRKKADRASRGDITDFSKEARLGFDGDIDVEEADEALAELEIVAETLDRALDAGIRVVEKIEPEPFEPFGHDGLPRIDVATRVVTFELRGTLEAIGHFVHLLQTRSPYLGVRELQLPAIQVKKGRTVKKKTEQKIKGDYVTARVAVQAFYANDGLVTEGSAAPDGEEEPTHTTVKKPKFF